MITHFLYAMALHPEWQKKLHQELDATIGGGRAPSFAEIQELKYFNAAWKVRSEYFRQSARPQFIPGSASMDCRCTAWWVLFIVSGA